MKICIYRPGTGIALQDKSKRIVPAEALAAGMRKHGDHVIVTHYPDLRRVKKPDTYDAFVCWGWRRGLRIRNRPKHKNDVLIMERAYVLDRFAWCSLAWNGLNNRGVVAAPVDGGARWQQHFGRLMKPWREKRDGYALVMGQVPSDMSCASINFPRWARVTVSRLQNLGWNVKFRPHPLHSFPMTGAGAPKGDLQEALDGAAFVVTYNSNSGVDAVLAGVPTVTMDPGSMAWDVSSHSLEDPIMMPERSDWAARLAWRQWLPHELEDGTAWNVLKASLTHAKAHVDEAHEGRREGTEGALQESV